MRASVIVPTCGRPDALAWCLEGLAGQADGDVDVVVVDDAATPDARVAAVVAGSHMPVRLVHGEGRGAAAARNRGAAASDADLLLFLDGDARPGPGWLAAHRRRHGDGSVAVVGPPLPIRGGDGLAERAAASWWEDELQSRRTALAAADVDLLSGNLSLRRDVFLRVGGFDETFGTLRREDFELGLRLHRAGVPVVLEEAAAVGHRLDTGTLGRLLASEREGAGDALMARARPELVPSLAVRAPAPHRTGRLTRVAQAAWPHARGRRVLLGTLAGLEHARLRRAWLRLFRAAHEAAWRAGAGPDPYNRRQADVPAMTAVEIHGDAPAVLPAGPAGLVDVRWGDRSLGLARPEHGRYDEALVAEMARLLPADVLLDAEPELPVPDVRHVALTDLHAHAHDDRVLVGADGSRPGDGWLARAACVLEAERVAAVVRAPGAVQAGCVALYSQRTTRGPHTMLNVPPHHVLVDPAALRAAGVTLDRLPIDAGPVAALLDLLERARAAGLQVAVLEPVSPRTTSSSIAWREFWRQRGVLEARDAAGATTYVRRHATVSLLRIARTSRRRAPGYAAAYLAGAADGLRRRMP